MLRVLRQRVRTASEAYCRTDLGGEQLQNGLATAVLIIWRGAAFFLPRATRLRVEAVERELHATKLYLTAAG